MKYTYKEIFWQFAFWFFIIVVPALALMVYLRRHDIEYLSFGVLAMIVGFQIENSKLKGNTYSLISLVLVFMLAMFITIYLEINGMQPDAGHVLVTMGNASFCV